MAFLGAHHAFTSERVAPLGPSAASAGAAQGDSFIAHVFSCVLAIGFAESGDSGVGEALGLTGAELFELVATFAPAQAPRLSAQPTRIEFDDEEQQLRALFERYRVDGSRETAWLASILARRSMSPNHLWQDLGLQSRAELNRLLRSYFPALAERNLHNMKWKKFFYRCLCELDGFTLCAAPSCAECADYASCFGEESGLSRIAPH